jgi:hypothetical protein
MFQSDGLNCPVDRSSIRQNRRIFRAQTRLNFFAADRHTLDIASVFVAFTVVTTPAPTGSLEGFDKLH